MIINNSLPFRDVYCVSLVDSIKRRKHVSSELLRNGIESFTFVDAIDKDSLCVEEAYRNNRVKLYPPCFRCGNVDCDCDNNVLIPTQVATFFSHMKIWKEISTGDDGLFLIVEDDVVFNESYLLYRNNIHSLINGLNSKHISRPLLVRLGWALCDEHTNDEPRVVSGVVRMSNPMYALNKYMAVQLLKEYKKIEHTVDVFLHHQVGVKYPNYTMFPPIAHELSWSHGSMESLVRPRAKRIKQLESMTDDESVNELKSYEFHIDNAIKRKILAVGHPRCGSGYMSALLKSYGIDAGHERMGKDGIVSWMFSVYDLNNPFSLNKYAQSRYYTSFEKIIMFTRDPLNAIPSIIRENNESEKSFDFRRKHIRLYNGYDVSEISGDLEKAIDTYYFWSLMVIGINKLDLIVRVEFDKDILLDFLRDNDFEVMVDYDSLPDENVNSDKKYAGKRIAKPVVTADDWLNLSYSYKSKLNELCSVLNYQKIFSGDNLEIIR